MKVSMVLKRCIFTYDKLKKVAFFLTFFMCIHCGPPDRKDMEGQNTSSGEIKYNSNCISLIRDNEDKNLENHHFRITTAKIKQEEKKEENSQVQISFVIKFYPSQDDCQSNKKGNKVENITSPDLKCKKESSNIISVSSSKEANAGKNYANYRIVFNGYQYLKKFGDGYEMCQPRATGYNNDKKINFFFKEKSEVVNCPDKMTLNSRVDE